MAQSCSASANVYSLWALTRLRSTLVPGITYGSIPVHHSCCFHLPHTGRTALLSVFSLPGSRYVGDRANRVKAGMDLSSDGQTRAVAL